MKRAWNLSSVVDAYSPIASQRRFELATDRILRIATGLITPKTITEIRQMDWHNTGSQPKNE